MVGICVGDVTRDCCMGACGCCCIGVCGCRDAACMLASAAAAVPRLVVVAALLRVGWFILRGGGFFFLFFFLSKKNVSEVKRCLSLVEAKRWPEVDLKYSFIYGMHPFL